MYCMNNSVVVNHHGLFVYLDLRYPSSFHNVSILCESKLYKNINVNSLYTYEYFEYLLGNLNYLGEEMFIRCWLGRCELAPRHDLDVVNAFDKMHVGYKIRMEWGIGGLKHMWKVLMKKIDSIKGKYNHFFLVIIIIINFVHRNCMDFTYEVIGDQI